MNFVEHGNIQATFRVLNDIAKFITVAKISNIGIPKDILIGDRGSACSAEVHVRAKRIENFYI